MLTLLERQLAFIVLKKLPYNIDDYKLDMFNEYGVGTKEENHGMLFVFAISDREYALEIGDGFEKGSTLRKDLETDFITEDMKNSLRSENYDAVVLQVTQYLEKLMLDEMVIVPVYEIPTKVLYETNVQLPADGYVIGWGFGNEYMSMTEK